MPKVIEIKTLNNKSGKPFDAVILRNESNQEAMIPLFRFETPPIEGQTLEYEELPYDANYPLQWKDKTAITAFAPRNDTPAVIQANQELKEVKATASVEGVENALIMGDLSGLSKEDRLAYYSQLCLSLGLNPLTKPFEYISLNGKLVLYVKKDATEQLRKLHNISIKILAREILAGSYVVTAQAATPEGRTDESVGAVYIENLKGDAHANAIMKAETKAKRRVTLSICGLGMLDESEMEAGK